MGKHEEMTQLYSTWGSKLLQHTSLLDSIQNKRKFYPVTIQLAPVEICDSDCAFCSVSGRPLKSYMPWDTVVSVLSQFIELGAKSIEITGGGNPLLYRDKNEHKDINDIIELAWTMSFEIGIITNSHDLKAIDPYNYEKIKWIRISLIKLDEGKEPADYHFRGFPEERLGFSYIIYDGVPETPRLKNQRPGTTVYTIYKLVELVQRYPKVKFVRLAGNCLIKGNNKAVRDTWKPIVDKVDYHSKFFIKDIGSDDGPFTDGCYVGMIRPYVAPDPHGNGYRVYVCTSHVLNTRTYDTAYALCSTDEDAIKSAWAEMNRRFQMFGYPYEVKGNRGCGWDETCKFCYYQNNNRILHTVAHEMPDKNFP